MSENTAFPNQSTLAIITQLARERDDRRKLTELNRKKKIEESKILASQGKFGDSDFVGMIEKYRTTISSPLSHIIGEGKINVAVRKRPVSERERLTLDHDAVTCSNPLVVVHHCKLKVDGITKALENTSFQFDHAFDEHSTNDEVYEATCLPLVEWSVLHDGRSTCFAYGQTGSGKTYTMEGLYISAARDIFACVRERKCGIHVKCSFFELYGAQCLDLLNERKICLVREDGKGEIRIDGLGEEEVVDEENLLRVLAQGAAMRTTRSTEMNADSSRSHAIFQISFSSGGKLSLIDLAGSERGQDTKNHDATRRTESAAINRSLLALKECIRALDPNSGCLHVPYRGSKLTMVLKDSFASDSRTVMISCVSPAASSSDHTLNTLRYADRVKENPVALLSHQSAQVTKSPKSPGSQQQAQTTTKLMLKSSSSVTPIAGISNNNKSPQLSSLRAKSPSLRTKSPAFVGSSQQKSPRPIKQQRSKIKSPAPMKSPGKRSRQPSPPPPPPPLNEDNNSDDNDSLSEEHKNIIRQAQMKKIVVVAPSLIVTPESVAALVDEEEQVLLMHMDVVQRSSTILANESKLLSHVQSTVDYDIDEYVAALDGFIEEKLQMLTKLRETLGDFKAHLRAEEYSRHLQQ